MTDKSLTQSPPVHRETVILPPQDLGGYVVRRTAKGRRGIPGPNALLAHTVISQLDVALVVQEHVVQLQVSINDPLAVQEVQRQGDLGGVEPGVLLRQPPLPLHVEHEVAPAHELDDEEQPGGRLEARVQADEEGVVGGGLEDVLLRLHPVDVLVVGDEGLLYHLHGVDALCLLQLHHQHLGVGAAAYHSDQLEVVEGVLALGSGL